MLPSIAVTFSEEPLSQNIRFQKNYYYTSTLLLRSYPDYLLFIYLFIYLLSELSTTVGVLPWVSIIVESCSIGKIYLITLFNNEIATI